MRILGLVMELRVTDAPVLCNALSIWLTVAVGEACFRIAKTPATCGVAMDVPSKLSNPPPGTDEVIRSPGANRERNVAWLENEETLSNGVSPDPSPVEPTLTEVEIHDGTECTLVRQWFQTFT